MSMWIETLRAEMAMLDEFPPPEEPVAEKEELVGIITRDDVKMLYGLSRKLAYEANKAKVEATYKGKKDDFSWFQLLNQTEIVNDLFWYEARVDFPQLQSHTHIGIREGWKLVKLPEDPGKAIFKKLLELGDD